MKKILVIEDAQSLRKDIVEMLSFEGFDAHGAENGVVGVQKAREQLPDLIVCDIMMPGMDGYHVLQEIRRDPQTMAIPFIFLTARTDRLDMRQGMELGADDFLTKPFTAAELMATVQARLEKRAALDEIVERKMETLRGNITLSLPHELRTPLNLILGFSDLLIADGGALDPTRVVDIARHIHSAGRRLSRLIENFLIYAQVELIASDPNQIAALRQVYSLYPKGTIMRALHTTMPAERQGDLFTDIIDTDAIGIAEDHLGRVLEELLDNAVKFSEPGKRISVLAGTVGEQYQITIADQGRGMTPEQTRSIGAYMQFDRLIYEQQGTGLGLILSKRLIELYGGQFTIYSAPDDGTRVNFLIPLRRDVLSEGRLVSSIGSKP
jgi:signal transduction histidine kinase